MAKPQQHHNRPKISEGPGEREEEEGGEGSTVEAEEEGRGGTQGDDYEDPPPSEDPTDNRRDMKPLETEKKRRWRKRRDTRRKGTGTEIPHGGHRPRSLM